MFGNQQSKIGVFRLLGGVFIAVAIDSNDAVGVFGNHGTSGIHTEGAYPVAVLFCAIYDFAFVKLIGDVGENLGRKFHPHADIHTGGFRGDLQLFADFFHPFTAAAANGNDTLFTGVASVFAGNGVAAVVNSHSLHGTVKVKIHLVLQILIEIVQNHIVDISA